ncbi:MAG: glycerophosphodiester phosphodiesterase [Anaerolineae bacterium]|nr:glycerophosphodiester phosphodiesterase [Anaerolineae bacterium]
MQALLDALAEQSTLVFGHRGASAYAPMNTIPAFELALKQGADGIELDVHRSLDGHAVIIHDFTVDHTTDGSGIITEKTLEQIKSLDAGRWFSDSYRGLQIPTLNEVFEAVGHKLFINIEIKSESQITDGVEQVTADVIAQHNMQQRVIVSSFNPLTLSRFRAIMPDVPIGFLYAPGSVVDTHAVMRQLDLAYEAEHPHHSMIDEAFMQQARSYGRYVNTWTVNEPERALVLRDLGVNAIITDKPDVMLTALRPTNK